MINEQQQIVIPLDCSIYRLTRIGVPFVRPILTERNDMDSEWILHTLYDAMDALSETITEIEEDLPAAKELLEQRIPMIYAKLNYAWHSRDLGSAAIGQIDHDQLVSFPEIFISKFSESSSK